MARRIGEKRQPGRHGEVIGQIPTAHRWTDDKKPTAIRGAVELSAKPGSVGGTLNVARDRVELGKREAMCRESAQPGGVGVTLKVARDRIELGKREAKCRASAQPGKKGRVQGVCTARHERR